VSAAKKPVEVLCSFVAVDGRVLYWTTPTPPLDVRMSAAPHDYYVVGHRCRPDRYYYYRRTSSKAEARP
jgi:hypothetical protein